MQASRRRSAVGAPRRGSHAGCASSRRKVFLTAVLGAATETEWADLWNLTQPSSILAEPGDSGFCFHRGAGLGASRTHLASQSPHCRSPDNTTQALTQTSTPSPLAPRRTCPTGPPGCKEPLPQITVGTADPAVLGRRETEAPPRKRKRAPASAHREPLPRARPPAASSRPPPASLPGFPGDGRK